VPELRGPYWGDMKLEDSPRAFSCHPGVSVPMAGYKDCGRCQVERNS
jgi:hypothetical protein